MELVPPPVKYTFNEDRKGTSIFYTGDIVEKSDKSDIVFDENDIVAPKPMPKNWMGTLAKSDIPLTLYAPYGEIVSVETVLNSPRIIMYPLNKDREQLGNYTYSLQASECKVAFPIDSRPERRALEAALAVSAAKKASAAAKEAKRDANAAAARQEQARQLFNKLNIGDCVTYTNWIDISNRFSHSYHDEIHKATIIGKNESDYTATITYTSTSTGAITTKSVPILALEKPSSCAIAGGKRRTRKIRKRHSKKRRSTRKY